MPTISIVVPCRNEAPYIRLLLEGIGAQSRRVDEIVVVDGSSLDGTREEIGAYAAAHPVPPVRLLVEPPVPIPAALNAGIRAASGEIIVRLDAHCHPDATYVARAVETLEATGAAIVGGVWEIVPGADSAAARAIALAVAHPLGAGDAAYRVGVAGAEPRDVDTVPFGCFRKTLWVMLGGFDEGLRANEDYEFNHRARQLGGRVLLDPRMKTRYFARPGFGALASQYFNYGWWKARMLARHPRSLRWRQAVPPLFLVAAAALLVAGAVDARARWLAAVAALAYLGILCAGALRIRRRSAGRWRDAALVPVAFMVVHVTWGAGLIAGLVAGRARRASSGS